MGAWSSTAWVLGFVTLAAPASARAEDDEDTFRFGNSAEAFVLGGIGGGGSFGSPGGGGFVGYELSLVWLKELVWGGVHADAFYDFGHGAGTILAGPELGYAVFGLDGGVGLRLGLEDDPEIGYHVRGLVTLGTFALFGRYGFWPDSTLGRHVGQVGILFKLPFWTSAEAVEFAR